jgi:CRISPR/Cas system-associated exonuclease Cas4 (RecB family)
MAYSHSAISTYENCPLKYKFSYIDRVSPPRKNIEAFLGIRVHESLEKLYRDMLYEKMCTLEELITFYNEKWNKEMHGNIHTTKNYDSENYCKMGERYLTDYYNTYQPFSDGQTIALEKRIFFPLDDTHWIVGVIDRITEKDGVFEVHDYKTSLYFPTKKDVHSDCQLALYALALDYLYDIKNIELVWHYLAFNKEIRIKKPSYEDAREIILKKIELIEENKQNENFQPKESSLCPYCSYQPLCPLFKHEYELEEMPVIEMSKEDGFVLVNKYGHVCENIDNLEKEKDIIKQGLIRYAKEHDIQYVYGSDKIVNVKTYQNIMFTDKNLVEKTLKENGIYEQYSRLNAIKLAKDLENANLSSQIIDELKKLTINKNNIRIYLRDLKQQ